MSLTLTDEQTRTIARLTAKMSQLGVEAKPTDQITSGPIVTIYRFTPFGSTKVKQVEALANDFAMTLGVEDVVVKRLTGESSVAVFVPNETRRPIYYRDVVSRIWQIAKTDNAPKIPLCFGVDHTGEIFVDDLSKLPHLLIAGSTGGGKSTLLSALITTMIYCVDAKHLKLILSDTKNVEFGHFIGAPHLMFNPTKTVKETIDKFDFVIDEMESRLQTFGRQKVRNILEYNLKNSSHLLPYIVVVIDELADILMSQEREDVDPDEKRKPKTLGRIAEERLSYIVQKSRAAGIHIIAATQRPSVNVVSGTIKANFPARLTFRLTSQFDSRTVLDTEGAEHLLSQGDMMYMSPNRPDVKRLHAPWIELAEIDAAVNYVINKGD